MRTELFVQYDLCDTTALQDAQESTESNAAFANIRLIKEDIAAPKYGTLEHNFFLLDGNCEEFPDNPDNLVYFSSRQSGADGTFAEKQSVNVGFLTKHSSIGLTFHFLDEYPLEIHVKWHDIFGQIIAEKTFYPDSVDYFARHHVEEYARLEIIFVKTLPYHNVKLQHIKYGTTILWGNDTIKTGKLINDTDPIADKIATDKLTFDLVDADDEFNLGNITGLHKFFQRKQRMLPYEIVEGRKITLGTFFLKDISTSKNISKLSAIDYKGMLANADFKDGKMYNGALAGTVIDEIMAAAGIEDYTVDDETANTPICGTLKIQTCQKALREVLFATGSIISTAHRTNIEIRKQDKEVKHTVERSRKFETSVKTSDYVSDINVKYKTWTLEDKVSEITKGNYGVGTHTIQLSSPAANLATNFGTIVKQMPYYVILKIDTAPTSEVKISGNKYIGTELAASSSIEDIKSGEVRNAKTFTGTLLDFAAAKKAADNILEYYQLQLILQVKYLAKNEIAGYWAELENTVKAHGNYTAAIESLTTDLTGGFISTAKARGYYKFVTEWCYAGNELYASDGLGEII